MHTKNVLKNLISDPCPGVLFAVASVARSAGVCSLNIRWSWSYDAGLEKWFVDMALITSCIPAAIQVDAIAMLKEMDLHSTA